MTMELFEHDAKLTAAQLRAFLQGNQATSVSELRVAHFVECINYIAKYLFDYDPDARIYLQCKDGILTVGLSTECEFEPGNAQEFLTLFGDAVRIHATTEKETEYHYLHLEFDFKI